MKCTCTILFARTRNELLDKLCKVIGLRSSVIYPDESYVITADNVMKMMAILMRFR